MKVYEINYSNTNTYLIEGTKGKLLFEEIGIDGEIIHTPGHSEDSD